MAKRCFVIMPFSETSERHTEAYWTNFFTAFLKPRIERLGYTCLRSQAQPSSIIKDILQELFEADLVISVLTDHNENVWYELGIRHVFRKGTIMIIEKPQRVPFDISNYGVLIYEDSIAGAPAFEEGIRAFIERIQKDEPIDSPVLEFLGPQVLLSLDKQRQEAERRYEVKRHEIEEALQSTQTGARRVRPEIKKSSKRVLWVDDNPANNEAILDSYRPRGVIFDLALSTKQALDFLAQSEYALIISDIGRGSDWEAGIHMIPEIRRHFPDAPPIVLYAHPGAVEAHGERARQLGASLVTASPQELVPWIESVLRN